jgi:hypothetical protein
MNRVTCVTLEFIKWDGDNRPLITAGELPAYQQDEPPLHTASPLTAYLQVSPKLVKGVCSPFILNKLLELCPGQGFVHAMGIIAPVFQPRIPNPWFYGMVRRLLITFAFSQMSKYCFFGSLRLVTKGLSPTSLRLMSLGTSFSGNSLLA